MLATHCSQPLPVLLPRGDLPELAEASARMSAEALATLTGREQERAGWVHAAHSEGLRLRPATPKAPAHPGNSRFHSASGYHSVQFLAGNKPHARYDPARRFRINYAGPCTKYEDFSTPEEAALVIARR